MIVGKVIKLMSLDKWEYFFIHYFIITGINLKKLATSHTRNKEVISIGQTISHRVGGSSLFLKPVA